MIYNNDIALLKLASPVEFTDYVRPLCLWEDDTDLNSIVHKAGKRFFLIHRYVQINFLCLATVVGFGFDETGYVTEQLTQAKMPVVSQEECIYSYPQFYSRFTSNKTLCAGFRNGKYYRHAKHLQSCRASKNNRTTLTSPKLGSSTTCKF